MRGTHLTYLFLICIEENLQPLGNIDLLYSSFNMQMPNFSFSIYEQLFCIMLKSHHQQYLIVPIST